MDKFFGIANPLDIIDIDCMNFIFLVVRVFIWKEKRLGKPCAMHDFIPYLCEQLLVDASSNIYRIKPFIKLLSENLLIGVD